MQVSVIIVAAGSGSRMGGGLNKVYLPLGKHRILTYSLRAFGLLPEVAEIICVHKEAEADLLAECIADADIPIPVKTVSGGASRHDSVRRGLSMLSPDCSWFAVHDGARPLITPQLIRTLLTAAEKHGAVIPAVPVKDTIKVAEEGLVERTLPRHALRAVQTPQVFRRDLAVHFRDGCNVTDDASYLEGIYPVTLCQGDPLNIKITTPGDLWFAETVLGKVDGYQW